MHAWEGKAVVGVSVSIELAVDRGRDKEIGMNWLGVDDI